MMLSGNQRLTLALACACVILSIMCSCLLWGYGNLQSEVVLASEQARRFADLRTQALQSDVVGATSCLNYVVGYYPSGSKQKAGSRLDGMVERERTRTVRDILAYLRTQTGEDLGERPEVWIRKYAKP